MHDITLDRINNFSFSFFLQELAISYNQNLLKVIALLIESECLDPNRDRQLMRIDRGRGWRHTMQMINGHDRECFETLRMHQETFQLLCGTLKKDYGLRDCRECGLEEAVAMFLETVAHDEVQRTIATHYQRNQETVNRKFHEVLDALVRMSQDIIKPEENELRQVNPILSADRRYYPFFSGCIGALDGTHVAVRVGSDKKEKYWNLRKQHPTMNVLAICNFKMEFIYTYVGTPGRAHDSKILTYCAQNDEYFPTPPEGRYFLVDSGYPNRKGYLSPYRRTRYHPHQWPGGPPTNENEMFNKRHSSLRSVVERTFGVWKGKFAIIRNPAHYDLQTHCKIVAATMTLHNFIRRSSRIDKDFQE
ncbi:PREDICTED: putative nuclease HARBI1 [Camelina sativa]|uniref:Nuclease HARBI1 n=1 Tax=Camelina sativa TaxID=90675 RepID=A0ABM0SKK3_CAMSA|nr:PREDICTED: putative nuclease HARBI1 [Camelina sativa]